MDFRFGSGFSCAPKHYEQRIREICSDLVVKSVRLNNEGLRWIPTGIERNDIWWLAVHAGSAKDMKY